jgi:hypothetical protein
VYVDRLVVVLQNDLFLVRCQSLPGTILSPKVGGRRELVQLEPLTRAGTVVTIGDRSDSPPWDVAQWNHRVIQPPSWRGILRSDTDEIIRHFQNERYTQALALVVSWGTMWRQPDAVWGWRTLENIEATLKECATRRVRSARPRPLAPPSISGLKCV